MTSQRLEARLGSSNLDFACLMSQNFFWPAERREYVTLLLQLYTCPYVNLENVSFTLVGGRASAPSQPPPVSSLIGQIDRSGSRPAQWPTIVPSSRP